jgi:SCY1-like protein 1
MQLGTNKVSASLATASLAAQLTEEAAAEEGTDGNPWGTDDLIDINADQDDWSKLYFCAKESVKTDDHRITGAFESAPAPLIVEPKPLPASGLGPKLQSSTSSFASSQTKGDFIAQDNHFDPWKDEDPLSTQSQPAHSTQPWKAAVPISDTTLSRPSSRISTPISSPPPEADGWESVEKKVTTTASLVPSMAGMSKEEKAAEMARRKEDRKMVGSAYVLKS